MASDKGSLTPRMSSIHRGVRAADLISVFPYYHAKGRIVSVFLRRLFCGNRRITQRRLNIFVSGVSPCFRILLLSLSLRFLELVGVNTNLSRPLCCDPLTFVAESVIQNNGVKMFAGERVILFAMTILVYVVIVNLTFSWKGF